MKTEHVSHILGTPRKKDSSNLPRNPRSRGQELQMKTDALGDWLVDVFRSPEYRPIFLKAAWRLDETTIRRHVATALELGKNPRAYFISLVKKEPRYYEVKQN